MSDWRKHPIEYLDEANDRILFSLVFTWHLPSARMRAAWRRDQGYQVLAGGPAVDNMPHYLEDVAQVGSHWPDALSHHNPKATFTTRGCIRNCPFCAVPRIEGPFRELKTWPVRPAVCDNNFLASSRAHFDKVIDQLKPLSGIDFSQGLDARLLTSYHAGRLAELRMHKVRLAWDNAKDEKHVRRAYELLRRAGIPARRIFFYALIGYKDTPADALYRLQAIRDLPAQPYPVRYQPLDALEKNSYVAEAWTEEELRRFAQYWTRHHYYRKLPFKNFVIDRAKPWTRPTNLVNWHTLMGRAA